MTAADVIEGRAKFSIERADCLDWLRALPEKCVDLVIGSPLYMDARLYLENGVDLGVSRDCRAWVEWMLAVTEAAVRVSRGLVLWVVAGVQRDNCYWPGCEGLLWEWWKRGGHCWRPVVWWKVDENDGGTGIPGSGGNVPGKRWLRADWEYVLCFKGEGGIPYDDPTVNGHEPVYAEVGGQMSNRTVEGRRINDSIGNVRNGTPRKERWTGKSGDKKFYLRRQDGTRKDDEGSRPMPKLANPGNVLPLIVKARVGGGHMGDDLCHANEAPYPEELPRFFITAYAPPGGIVADCFSGSGTTCKVAVEEDRRFIGCDLRQSQVDLGLRRVSGCTPTLFPA